MAATTAPSGARMLDVAIVGPGRLGRSAAAYLKASDLRWELVGRGAVPQARITWLCVPDREIAAVAQTLPSPRLLLHASGALEDTVLGPRPERGSLHPLMSFPGPEVALPDPTRTPAAVSGTPRAHEAALELAHALRFQPFDAPADRVLYHAAAVIAGNYASTLLIEATRILARAGVADASPALLAPLAHASLDGAVRAGSRGITGPIARGDEAVVDRHRAALPEETRALYEALAEATRRLVTDRDRERE